MPQARDECPANRNQGRKDATGDYRRAQDEANRLEQGAAQVERDLQKFYVAKVAQADRDSKLHESRKGVHATNKQIEEMNVAVKDGLGKRFKRHAERIILRKNGVTK